MEQTVNKFRELVSLYKNKKNETLVERNINNFKRSLISSVFIVIVVLAFIFVTVIISTIYTFMNNLFFNF